MPAGTLTRPSLQAVPMSLQLEALGSWDLILGPKEVGAFGIYIYLASNNQFWIRRRFFMELCSAKVLRMWSLFTSKAIKRQQSHITL